MPEAYKWLEDGTSIHILHSFLFGIAKVIFYFDNKDYYCIFNFTLTFLIDLKKQLAILRIISYV